MQNRSYFEIWIIKTLEKSGKDGNISRIAKKTKEISNNHSAGRSTAYEQLVIVQLMKREIALSVLPRFSSENRTFAVCAR